MQCRNTSEQLRVRNAQIELWTRLKPSHLEHQFLGVPQMVNHFQHVAGLNKFRATWPEWDPAQSRDKLE